MASPGYPTLDPSLLPSYGGPTSIGNPLGYNFAPDLTTNDPNRLYRNAQNIGYNYGQGNAASLFAQQQQQQGLYGQYGNAMNQAYGALAQQPGYSAQDAQNIIQADRINGAVTTPDQYASLAPTGQEQAGIIGDPSQFGKYYNPQAINDITGQMADIMRGGVQNTESKNSNALGQQQQSLSAALDPSQLNMSSQYANNNSNVLNATADRLGTAQDTATGRLDSSLSNSGLNVTQDYLKQAGMSDAEVAQAGNQAATNVGLQAQAQKDSIARAAAAAGNASPLAVAAAQARAGVQGMVATGDAVTDAQLAARAQQRQAASGIQQTQLGAAQYQTGAGLQAGQYLGSLGSQNAQYEGNLAQNAVQQQENTRLAAAQYLAGQNVNAANQIAANQLQANEYTGAQGQAAEQAIGSQGLQGQEYQQNLGTNIATSQEQAAQQRAAQLYGIRQGNTQYQQQSGYQQGMGSAGALSQGYQTVANQGLSGQQQYRNWLTGQTGQALGASQTAQGQQIQNYGAMTGAMNQNAGQWGNYQLGKAQQPSTWQQVVGGIAGAAAGFGG